MCIRDRFSVVGQGFIRINLATHTKNIEAAVESIIKNIKERLGE